MPTVSHPTPRVFAQVLSPSLDSCRSQGPKGHLEKKRNALLKTRKEVLPMNHKNGLKALAIITASTEVVLNYEQFPASICTVCHIVKPIKYRSSLLYHDMLACCLLLKDSNVVGQLLKHQRRRLTVEALLFFMLMKNNCYMRDCRLTKQRMWTSL